MRINLNDLENYKDLHPRFEDMAIEEVVESCFVDFEEGDDNGDY